MGLLAGVAYSGDGKEQAGMGVDAGDYDNDGDLDIVKTNFFRRQIESLQEPWRRHLQ